MCPPINRVGPEVPYNPFDHLARVQNNLGDLDDPLNAERHAERIRQERRHLQADETRQTLHCVSFMYNYVRNFNESDYRDMVRHVFIYPLDEDHIDAIDRPWNRTEEFLNYLVTLDTVQFGVVRRRLLQYMARRMLMRYRRARELPPLPEDSDDEPLTN